MKLHGLMLQHHDDLGRIIVSSDVHLDAREKSAQKACRHLRMARPWQKERAKMLIAQRSSSGSVGYPFRCLGHPLIYLTAEEAVRTYGGAQKGHTHELIYPTHLV